MTIGAVTPLTDLERDALGEVSNIAMARAANSLRQMVEHQVLLSVPAVEILSQDAAAQLVAKPDNPNLVAVRQDFSGAFSGRALLIFPEANSLELVRAVVGRELPLEDIVDLEDEALAETGNIILNSWVATIANLLKRGLKMSLPVVVRGDSRRMFETAETSEPRPVSAHQVRDQQERDSRLCRAADGYSVDGRTKAAHRRLRHQRHPEKRPGPWRSRILDLTAVAGRTLQPDADTSPQTTSRRARPTKNNRV